MSTDENNDTKPEETTGEQLDEVFASDESPAETSAKDGDEDVQKLAEENAELKDRVLRAQAELENFRRRTQKEQLDAMKYQSLSVIRELLPGMDNLKRAIDAAEQSGDTQNLIDGIKMVAQQFQDVLKSQSCEAINPEGESFDPNFHEALTQVPSADHDPMTVLQVIEPGYRLHDRVIRPAKVMVSCAPPQPAAEAAKEEDSTEENQDS